MKIPEGVNVEVHGNTVKVKGPKAELEKRFNHLTLSVKVKDGEIEVKPVKKATRKVNAAVGAVKAHLKNMLAGVQKEFVKKLEVAYAHFPVSIEVKGKQVMIKNFLGEKNPRHAAVKGDAKVEVQGQEIIVSGHDKEDVGQTAANLVNACGIGRRDARIFQDGIYYK